MERHAARNKARIFPMFPCFLAQKRMICSLSAPGILATAEWSGLYTNEQSVTQRPRRVGPQSGQVALLKQVTS